MRCKLYRDWYFRGKLIKAGRIAGGNGASGRGYVAAGGGGGASTNGANSGSGADGNPGVVIVISVDYE